MILLKLGPSLKQPYLTGQLIINLGTSNHIASERTQWHAGTAI
jgi:hypothetical protein